MRSPSPPPKGMFTRQRTLQAEPSAGTHARIGAFREALGFQEHAFSTPRLVPPTPAGKANRAVFSVHFATMNSSLRPYDLQHAPDQGDRKPHAEARAHLPT